MLARKFGISRVLPEDEKGEVDTDALNTAGAGVYVDPKTRFGGIFVAIDSDGEDLVTNDPEAAKQHAKRLGAIVAKIKVAKATVNAGRKAFQRAAKVLILKKLNLKNPNSNIRTKEKNYYRFLQSLC